MAFVDVNRLKSCNTYINQLVANSYLTRIVVNWNSFKNTMSLVVSSLQDFGVKVENSNSISCFVVQNVTVENTINAQQMQFQPSA
jgi:hypothetical protein